MRVGTPGFVPGRLTEARAARRIVSMTALARLLSISPSTVARWEDGSSSPDPETLAKIADQLRVRREFFLRPTFNAKRTMFSRSQSATLVRDVEYQKSQMSWMHEISSVVQHYVDLPAVDVPDLMEGANYRQLRDEDIEQIALRLRKHWGLGEGPCTDVVALLERIGCVVGAIEMGTSKLDGLCSWSDAEDRPHVLLATDKMSFARRQMDAAHEMAHLVLHKFVSEDELKANHKVIETQAFKLASAFLLPSTTYICEVSEPSLAQLVSLKERWRVSIKAQIKRLCDLKVIPSDHATYLYKLYSMKGWSREEPFDKEWKIPSPRTLSDALQLIVDAGVRTKADLLAVEFTMQAGDIENIAALPPGWFSEKAGQIVQLKIPQRESKQVDGTGEIVPFGKRS
jgi:Zn-dependent peptidase ImmA (M78 family)